MVSPEKSAQPPSKLSMSLVKPRLRGWLHAASLPLAAVMSGLMFMLAESSQHRIAVAVFAASSILLFTVSAIFHRGTWGPRAYALLRRFDHANIFLVIAGSYTPFALLLLPPTTARTLLIVVWTGALIGIAFRVLWLHAPRWVYTPAYVALGWAAVIVLPDFWATGQFTVLGLVLLGGLLYTAGGIIYALRRPNPWPRWFGFHEVFHACTVAAFAAHAVGVCLALLATRGTAIS